MTFRSNINPTTERTSNSQSPSYSVVGFLFTILNKICASLKIYLIAILLLAIVCTGIYRQMYSSRGLESLEVSGKTLPSAFSWADSNEDGLPDGLILSGSDADNFRHWLTLIGEYQFYRISPKWTSEQRDCSGLIRFAMREALKRHKRAWAVDFGADARFLAAAPADVELYNFDDVPVGDKLFRTRDGKFELSDLKDGTLSEFADARTLKAFNTRFITRDSTQAKPGDLIFFYEPRVRNFPFHTMLFLGRPVWEPDGADDWVVYHTGASADAPGIIKKVRLSELMKHPDRRWHPEQANPGFLGFYRLKILN
jgi:uncharacterized protein